MAELLRRARVGDENISALFKSFSTTGVPSPTWGVWSFPRVIYWFLFERRSDSRKHEHEGENQPAYCSLLFGNPGHGSAARWIVPFRFVSDTNPLDGGEEKAMVAALQRRGLDTFVVPVERSDWLKVASAVVTLDFWKGTCRPDGPAYSWYLQKVWLGVLLLRNRG